MDKPKWLKKANKELPWLYPMPIHEGRIHGVMQIYNFDIDLDKRNNVEVSEAIKWIDKEMECSGNNL